MTTTCGFIGLGQMGAPMARNLVRRAQLVVWARDARQADTIVAAGATRATGSSSFSRVQVVFLCLPDGAVVDELLFGAFGLAVALPRGAIILDTSTIDYGRALALQSRLAAMDITFIDAPVSGMQARAEAGTLTMMCGATEGQIAPLRPLLETMASTILPMGKPGSGQLAKLINQLLFDINAAALAEVLPLAVKLGLDPDKVGAIVNSGTGRSYASEFFIPNILKGDFSKGYPMEAAYKDLVSGAEISARHTIPMPVLAAATVVYQSALRAGHGNKDKGGMIRLAEEALSVAFRSKTGMGPNDE
jgi:3-hydroxyisobutyrate dehydrogenase-like beta-hydroxyacid dehydrogenase